MYISFFSVFVFYYTNVSTEQTFALWLLQESTDCQADDMPLPWHDNREKSTRWGHRWMLLELKAEICLMVVKQPNWKTNKGSGQLNQNYSIAVIIRVRFESFAQWTHSTAIYELLSLKAARFSSDINCNPRLLQFINIINVFISNLLLIRRIDRSTYPWGIILQILLVQLYFHM